MGCQIFINLTKYFAEFGVHEYTLLTFPTVQDSINQNQHGLKSGVMGSA